MLQKLDETNLKVGQWVCLEDLDGNLGRFVQVDTIDTVHKSVYLTEEDSMDRWGGKIEGETLPHDLPIYGVIQG